MSYFFPQDSGIFMKEGVGTLQEHVIVDTFKETLLSGHNRLPAHMYTHFCVITSASQM